MSVVILSIPSVGFISILAKSRHLKKYAGSSIKLFVLFKSIRIRLASQGFDISCPFICLVRLAYNQCSQGLAVIA